jgi:hypothetical protein
MLLNDPVSEQQQVEYKKNRKLNKAGKQAVDHGGLVY